MARISSGLGLIGRNTDWADTMSERVELIRYRVRMTFSAIRASVLMNVLGSSVVGLAYPGVGTNSASLCAVLENVDGLFRPKVSVSAGASKSAHLDMVFVHLLSAVILRLRDYLKVARKDTTAVVAKVVKRHSFRDGANKQLVGCSVSHLANIAYYALAVSIGVMRASPFPTAS